MVMVGVRAETSHNEVGFSAAEWSTVGGKFSLANPHKSRKLDGKYFDSDANAQQRMSGAVPDRASNVASELHGNGDRVRPAAGAH
jgi:hypothetical protein